MTNKTYKTLSELTGSSLYRDAITGKVQEAPQSQGLGSRTTAPTTEEEQSMFDTYAVPILRRLGLMSDDPEQIADAVVPQLQRSSIGSASMEAWSRLPPPPTPGSVGGVLDAIPTMPSSSEATPPFMYTESAVDFTANARPVQSTSNSGGADVDTRATRTRRSMQEANTERTDFSNSFYMNIGVRAETDHGSTPQVSNDAADVASGNTTYDIGYGHKITSSEFASGEIHGIQFIDDNGDYIPLTQEQKEQIMAADFEMHQQAARDAGWDQELEDRDSSWDELDTGYQNALTSLAYNVGGTKAGQQWSNIFDYAVAGSRATNDEEERAAIRGFARHLRRKDAGSNTAGMDNRVAKELYFAGLIDSLDDVSSVLTLADADQAGIPQSAEYGSNPNRRPSGSQD